ncbi:hypothetical protein A3770_06p44880 [Chloropicon primus]|uniref:VHS domain-containing protein n=1 Tax=Chloropicon primus TaxID=1764295 RepID=A0A5B8MRE3_9CHLO|nr:hypothetical protein A3770_06p44880 [Chloropicon primus]|eukprot:QDZ21970.1 hypothetical protein A3770_06p44880 [Chloropicon primus]
MPLLNNFRKKSRPAVHSGLLGSESPSSASADVFSPPPPPVRAESPPTTEHHVSGPASTDSYLQLGNHVRALVREATRKKLKDVDHDASTRVVNFVKHNQCPVVLEEMAKILCEKLSSNWANKQWLAVKLTDRLYSSDAKNFDGTQDMVVQELTMLFQKHTQLHHPTSDKCRIEASRLLQKMTGLAPQVQVNQMMGGHLVFAPAGGSVPPQLSMNFPHQAAAGRPGGALEGDQFFQTLVGNGRSVHARPSPMTVTPAAFVDPNALKREVLEKAGMTNQHADILQELLCNFSTSDSSEQGEEADTLEMLSELSEQSKALLSDINGLVLKCQEHIESRGIAQAVEESTMAIDKLKDALDLYEDVKHTRQMMLRRTGGSQGALAAGSSQASRGVVDGVPVYGDHDPGSSRGVAPTPPPASAARASTRVDTNPFRRLTRDNDSDGHQAVGRQNQGRPRGSSQETSTAKGPGPATKSSPPLIDVNQDAGSSSQRSMGEASQPAFAASGSQDQSKEMQQLMGLFDTSMDLLSSSGSAGGDGGEKLESKSRGSNVGAIAMPPGPSNPFDRVE